MSQLTRRQFVTSGAIAGIAFATLTRAGTVLADDNRPVITVGSMDFTEQRIVGEMAAQVLEHAGYSVKRTVDLGGTAAAQEALVNGDLDLYLEYTGGALIAVLGLEMPASAQPDSATPEIRAGMDDVYDTVARAYDEQFQLTWLEPWGFNDTYSMAVTSETANELGLKSMSDLEPHAADMTLGTDEEFSVRADGLPGYEDDYGYSFGEVVPSDVGQMYTAVADGEVDVITSYSTDGRNSQLELVLLDDDKHYFPPYYAAPVVRQDVLQQAPEIADVLNQVGGRMTNESMTALNYKVDVDGLEPAEVARTFLTELGLLD